MCVKRFSSVTARLNELERELSTLLRMMMPRTPSLGNPNRPKNTAAPNNIDTLMQRLEMLDLPSAPKVPASFRGTRGSLNARMTALVGGTRARQKLHGELMRQHKAASRKRRRTNGTRAPHNNNNNTRNNNDNGNYRQAATLSK